MPKMANEISLSPGRFKNAFLEGLQTINTRITSEEGNQDTLRAKL